MTSVDYTFENKDFSPVLQKSDLDEDLIETIYSFAFDAIKAFTIEKDISDSIKDSMEAMLGKGWQVVVGTNFAVSLTHESSNFIFFSMNQLYFLVFKL